MNIYPENSGSRPATCLTRARVCMIACRRGNDLTIGQRSILVVLILSLTLCQCLAGGTWTALTRKPPTNVNACILLSDGTVLTWDDGAQCNKLTPDIHGSYINGTWTRVAGMNYARMDFASQLLTNGQVFVAGGEYGLGHDHGELYDPLNDIWNIIPDPIPGVGFSDAISETLPNGNVLLAPVSEFGGCLIYNASANTWQAAGSTKNQNEVAWTKLPSDCILTINTGSTNSGHYVPSLNEWIADENLPVVVYGKGAELGPGFLLPNGNVFYIGGTTNTAIYTPGSTPTSPGSWVAGPVMAFGTNLLGAVDAPAAMMINGKILCDIGPIDGSGPCFFYEYDYISNTFAQVSAPGGGSTYASAPFAQSMLCLPDGSVLFVASQNTQTLFIYTPDGSPLAAGQPAINSITENADGSYHLTGTGLNGISEGAAYGDDEQMASDYPIVRMTNNSSQNVYYARTYNRNSASVQTGSRVLTTEFTLPQNLPGGAYSLVAVANGNPSAPHTFTYSPPAVPAGLTAQSGSNGFVTLSWNSSANATAYNVKRATSSMGYSTNLATVTGLGFTNTGLTNGLTYYYKVAAVGSGGPSSDSAAVSATPAGPTLIPGATSVSLAGYYNRAGIYPDGLTFSGSGFDNDGTAYSANLLGPSVYWNNLVFTFGPPNALDAVYCANQTITLPNGQFNSLQILAAGVNGSQTNQTFAVTYTDNSTATFTQTFSDWAASQSFPGEVRVVDMPYKNKNTGANQYVGMHVYGYVFALDQTRTVQSITLPNNPNLVLLAMAAANNPVPVPLETFFNRAGIYSDGTTYTNPPTYGIDGGGYSYSARLLGTSQTWSNSLFTFGPFNATNVISCTNQIIPLPAGNYSQLRMLGTAVNGNQASQSIVVTYSDSTTATFTQSFSDWYTPQNYSGETKVLPMSYRNNTNGTSTEGETFYLYGYSFKLDSSKTVQSVQLPNDSHVIVTAISLVPNWPPTFNLNPFTLASVTAGNVYAGSIATNASDLNGDTMNFSKVSGPAWLVVGGAGGLGGTPLSADVGNNDFVVQATNPGGLSGQATLNIQVLPAPPITLSLVPQGSTATLNWSGGISPYQVYRTKNLSPANWQPVGPPLSSNNVVISVTNAAMFYRVSGE